MSATPAYPLLRPATNDDVRFSLGLALDVAAVLPRHGYPPLTAGADLVRLQQALFGLIYQPNNASDQPLDKPSPIGNQIPWSASLASTWSSAGLSVAKRTLVPEIAPALKSPRG
jgi:hypothetical protein